MAMAQHLRKSGIEVLGNVPWGTHFCQFYETPNDLLETEAAYFKAGLENNEYCLWIIAEQSSALTVEDAANTLRKSLPDVDAYLIEKKLEIVSREEWFYKEGNYDLSTTATHFAKKLNTALEKGFEGMRVNGGGAWLIDYGNDLHTLEKEIDQFISGRPVLMLCNFSLPDIQGNDIFDVMNNHQFGIAKRNGKWEVFETPELQQAKEELKMLNEKLEKLNNTLEKQVEERTQQLIQAIQKLEAEVTERKKAEELLNESHKQIRSLIEHLQDVREEEQIRIARELYDELGQQLTVLKLKADLLKTDSEVSDDVQQEQFKSYLALVDTALQSVRRISSELRPTILDDMGLIATMDWHLKEFESQTNVHTSFVNQELLPFLPAKIQTAVYRIFQEALTNVSRHAKASELHVSLTHNDTQLRLSIQDNGTGFDPRSVMGKKTLGILGMKERAALIEADFYIQSNASKGTTITLLVPLL
jgi:signal transduction histidine kinase